MSSVLDNIRIVLVNPINGGNIGGAARAMKNMGLSRLYLVTPERFPDREAGWRAASAGDVLAQAVVCPDLDTAVADCGLVVGTSARDRTIPWPLRQPRQVAVDWLAVARTQPVAILFGREDCGLSNEELQRCALHVAIPTSPDYSSLNLAMAVQIVAYELFLAAAADGAAAVSPASRPVAWDQRLATQREMELLYAHLEQTLIRTGFLTPDKPRQLMPRLRRLFNRARLDAMEMNILRGALASVDKLAASALDADRDAEERDISP